MDYVVQGLTYLGDPVIMLLIAAVMVFAVSRDLGLKMSLALIGAIITYSSIKMFVGDPRPYELDPDLGVVTAMGFGFPSGHTVIATVFWAGLALWSRGPRKATFWVIGIVTITLVGFTRMYLGVHFPTDVVGGLIIGAGVLGIVGWIARLAEKYRWPQIHDGRGATRLVTFAAALVAVVSLTLSVDLLTTTVLGSLAGIVIGMVRAPAGRDPGFSYSKDALSILKRAVVGLAVLFILGWIAMAGVFLGGAFELILPSLAALLAGIWVADLSSRSFIRLGLAVSRQSQGQNIF